jgi:hypothetical protein
MTAEKYRVNILRSEWLAPCTPRQLFKVMKDTELQKQLDANTD